VSGVEVGPARKNEFMLSGTDQPQGNFRPYALRSLDVSAQKLYQLNSLPATREKDELDSRIASIPGRHLNNEGACQGPSFSAPPVRENLRESSTSVNPIHPAIKDKAESAACSIGSFKQASDFNLRSTTSRKRRHDGASREEAKQKQLSKWL
jgi:hypothetical protein